MLKLKWPRREPSELDQEIEMVIGEMHGCRSDTGEYTRLMNNLKTLKEIKATEPKKLQISPDTIVIATANIVGIVLILLFERTGTITSKALPFIPKARP